MKKTELILWIIAAGGEALSLVPIPGGILLFVLSMLLLAILYFTSSTFLFNNIRASDIFNKATYKDIPTSNIYIGSIYGPITGLGCLGILMKLLHFPGATFYLVVATLLSLPLLILSIIKVSTTGGRFYKTATIRVAAFAVLFVAMFFINTRALNKIRYRNCVSCIEAINRSEANPKDRALQKEMEKEEEKANYPGRH